MTSQSIHPSESLPWAVAFDDRLDGSIDAPALLGGKGAGLVEMTQQLGLPVPPGFVITTEVCRRYRQSGWPPDLDAVISEQVERLNVAMGARFGDPRAPLLVSVRSGAPISMPGMMDTLLNVGVTPAIREALAASPEMEVFAADTWLRFCRMYAEIVVGVSKGHAGSAAEHDGSAEGTLLAAERVRRLAAEQGRPIPTEPMDQLRGAIEAVFRSCDSERARVFRAHEGIPEDLGTAVAVQAMAFGNLDDRSGTGVVFTRDPATGEAHPVGDYLVRAQGEDVVAGTHRVGGLEALREHLPGVHAELCEVLGRLERHYRDMCDVEFTVSAGRLFILQTRVGRRSPLAAVRIAVAMAQDPAMEVDRAEAVARVDADTLQHLASGTSVAPGAATIARGLAASPGVGTGLLCCDPNRAAALSAEGTAVILAREATAPEDVHGMIGAAGIITTRGGVVSHAAVVARSWSIPAVTSLEGVVVEARGIRTAGLFIAEGELLTVDGSTGALYRGDQRAGGSIDIPEVRILREWAAELGVEPGTRAAAAATTVTAEVSLLELVRAVQLKGLCSAERVAAYLSTMPETVIGALQASSQLFKETPRGTMLSAEGRAWLLERLAEERTGVDTAELERCYSDFSPLNDRFKRLVTGWQLLGEDGRTSEAFASLAAEMQALHADFCPVVEGSAAQLPRLAAYWPRFERALAELVAGDASMLASPMKESYHTLWFDYHEELIALTGRDRAEEET